MQKFYKLLLLAFLFLLPWQTRWIFEPAYLNGKFWEYGSSSWYGTEILLWLIIILFSLHRLPSLHKIKIFGASFHRRNFFLTLAFLIFLGVAVLHSIDIGISYNFFFHLLEGLCLFLILSEEKNRQSLLLAFWGGGIAQAMLGTYQFFTQSVAANKWLGLALQAPWLESSVIESGTERWLRAYGSFGSPNILGGYLAVLLVLGLVLYLRSKPSDKIFLTLGQAIILTGLILSFSRGAWVGAFVGIIIVIILGELPQDDDKKRYAITKQLLFYFAIVFTLFIILKPLFITRLSAAQRLERYSLSERRLQYSESAGVFKRNMFFGVGPGAYTLALSREKPRLPGDWYQPVHNIYVLILAEWGMIGAIVWLLIFAWLLSLVWRRNPAFLPVVAVMLVLGVFDHYWWSLYSGIILWWTVFGLAFFSYPLDNLRGYV